MLSGQSACLLVTVGVSDLFKSQLYRLRDWFVTAWVPPVVRKT